MRREKALRLEKVQMYREISEEPEILAKIWSNRESIHHLSRKLSKVSWILLTAFGSSYNAALYGQVLFYRFLGIPSFVATPGFFLNRPKKFKMKNGLLIAISQSGKIREVLEVVDSLGKSVRTLAVTNDLKSPLAHLSDEVLALGAGPEKSIPATKTFIATLYNLQLLVAYWKARFLLEGLSKTEEMSRRALGEKQEMKNLAKKVVMKSRGFILASEVLKPIASEGSLKLNECAYFMAEAFEWREFFHGPIALAQKDTPAFLLCEPGKEKAWNHLTNVLTKRGVYTYPLALPKFPFASKIQLAAIPFSILLQILALYLALLKGRNPDHPRSLEKITQTPVR